MTEPTDDLRRAVIHAIARRQSLAAKPGGDPADLADAAIAAYRGHPDGGGSFEPAAFEAGKRAGWIACRDAAAEVADLWATEDQRSPGNGGPQAAIRALTPPEPAP